MKRTRIFILFLVLWVFLPAVPVHAEDNEDMQGYFLDELDLGEVDKALGDSMNGTGFSFSEAVMSLVKGDTPLNMESIGDLLWNTLFSELEQNREVAVHVLILVIAAAVFTNFTNIFEKSQVGDISFYMIYLLLFTLLMQAFYSISVLTAQTLANVVNFMQVLMPVYFLAVSIASGSVTAGAFYEFTLLLITGLQMLMKYFLIPAVNLYVLFMLLNHLAKEEYLSKMADLLKLFVEWSIKTMIAVVVGFQTVQCLVMPAVDALKTAILNKAAGSIPGVGNAFNAVTEVVLGSAVLIKNAVGAAGLIVLAVICIVPLMKLGICTLLYKLMAAVVQPVSDKRMVECIGAVGDGAGLLLKVLGTTGILFFLSLAMVTASVTAG
ncbi:stage III sporulation protein AE [Murimonas intestini]|uniref:Stage III sporulation protein AE n=1 Tax=Murimonas intestini TaxID=1337051 RepID=A0AB73T7A6_9FIRM|nr:stage III sporulation protein AE [Murimonas intestini]MCR1841269.1 stage III sporulation protein AE [Murimonas intestini]MCR1866187.1 stage III sporulation protein AE [Murimonas intestini]MCR1882696.1 stage III sporulation protein AE [Murimonas intestini]